MAKEIINLPGVTSRPYSQAVRAGDFIYCSGTGGQVDANGKPVSGITAQTKQVIENLANVLKRSGASLADVVKCTVFIKNTGDFGKMNEAYATYFKSEPPARSTIVCGLVREEMEIEIECIAYKPE